jgi:hypothetical protein
MTDRELLELAAKAAGIEIDKSEFNGGGRGNTGFDTLGNAVLDWHNYKTWNPLTDDGDALRLAVKLRMQILIGDGGMCHASSGENGEVFSIYGKDLEAATRRAIVRAAAEIARSDERQIGKEMK